MAFTMTVAELIDADTSGMLGKHATWERVPLAEVATILNGAPFDSALFGTTAGMPLIRIRDVITGETSTYYSGAYEDAYLVQQGDLLIGMDGDFNSGFWGRKTALLNQRVCKISPIESLYDKQLLSLVLPGYLAAINANTPSVTVKHLSSKTIGEIGLPLPPRAEQARIVAKLEELLTDLDAGVDELKAAQKKLKQYRQSLLKSAVEGSLTAEWRAQHTPAETGAQLLQRILTERRARWEAKQLAKFKEQDKARPKDWQKKYPEPVQPDITDLAELPEGWVWATLSQAGWLDRGRSKHRPRSAEHLYGGPYPFVQTGTIRHSDTFISSVETTYSEAGLAQSRLWPIGTMCITIAANIGKTAILTMEACFPDSVVGFLPATEEVSIRYVEYFMRSIQQKLENEAPATAQKNINLEILEKVVIPIPPFREQCCIVDVLDSNFDAARENDRSIELGLKQSTAQRKNILRAAFAGHLVMQDPNDEPASVLLDRIRVARAGREKQSKIRKTKQQKVISSVVSKLIDVLAEADDWLPAQEAFRRCGVVDGTLTDCIEELYAQLRQLHVVEKRVQVKPVINEHGLRTGDLLKLIAN
ncbi:restriction endonuclease subunit S [Pseudomonas viridiflava]|uniref:restriction endonuclease subunit S n=1 Tax=Pseudomonas viridiflava TaxID=33069 RepID=UPI0013CEBE7A|nr:restriction endonuclease subunit S [Pseudomonas viridiflava]MEE4220979.1 restriction endonuclease subunit S [Pseudomonas viridiflava]